MRSAYILASYRTPGCKAKKGKLKSREVATGNLDVKVDFVSSDEFGWLAYSFNRMSSALKERDEKLKEFTKRKISESERLAMVGQLSAYVAHELNNPLQGIVTYASLALEKETFDESCRQNITKIVVQANRCRDIIRGLLDFSRQKNPDKTLCNVNNLLRGCISLVENQAIFHNIGVMMNLDHLNSLGRGHSTGLRGIYGAEHKEIQVYHMIPRIFGERSSDRRSSELAVRGQAATPLGSRRAGYDRAVSVRGPSHA